VFEKTLSRKSRNRGIIVSEELQNASKCSPSTLNAKCAFSNSSGLKSVFEKLRFRDGLVWTVSRTKEIKLRFQISPAEGVRGFRHRKVLTVKFKMVITCTVEYCNN